MNEPVNIAAPDVIVVGASARAACFSAARAGCRPFWIDQFGDADLRAAFPGAVVAANDYPSGILAALAAAPNAPVFYTGALENHPRVLEHVASSCTLLGNSAATCAMSRDPLRLASVLRTAGIPFPPSRMDGAAPAAGQWLQKPLRSGGGLGIARAAAGAQLAPGHYWQQRVAGEAQSAVYVADAGHATLLGVTRQMVGWPEFHAPEFSYCGSLGPLVPAPELHGQWRTIGNVLARALDLRGLFGVDAVVADDRVTVIEVNPRYTASVEVLEAALGVAAVRLHLTAWGEAGEGPTTRTDAGATGGAMAGKAILFAPRDLAFRSGAVVAGAGNAVFADIPAPGAPVAAGAPILSVLCRADTAAECESLLRRAAADVYRVLL